MSDLMDSLISQLIEEHFYKEVHNGITFTLKKMDGIEFNELIAKAKKSENQMETELLISAIKNVEGMKVKHLTNKPENFTAEKLEENLPFNKELIALYLGKNNEFMLTLFSKVAKNFMDFTTGENNKKKVTSDTESKD